jgi:hypothetical protein
MRSVHRDDHAQDVAAGAPAVVVHGLRPVSLSQAVGAARDLPLPAWASVFSLEE